VEGKVPHQLPIYQDDVLINGRVVTIAMSYRVFRKIEVTPKTNGIAIKHWQL
jgi:hypothetical protein